MQTMRSPESPQLAPPAPGLVRELSAALHLDAGRLLTVLLLVPLAAAFGVWRTASSSADYRAHATVYLRSFTPQQFGAFDVVPVLEDLRATITSDEVAQQVAADTGVSPDALERITTERIGEGTSVRVSFTALDPEAARSVVEAAARGGLRTLAARSASAASRELDDAQRRLGEVQTELEALRQEAGGVDVLEEYNRYDQAVLSLANALALSGLSAADQQQLTGRLQDAEARRAELAPFVPEAEDLEDRGQQVRESLELARAKVAAADVQRRSADADDVVAVASPERLSRTGERIRAGLIGAVVAVVVCLVLFQVVDRVRDRRRRAAPTRGRLVGTR